MTQLVDISSLVRDYTIYPRTHIDSSTVRRLVDAIEAGEVLPPIIADRKTSRIVDGFHRLSAAEATGATALEVEFRDYGTEAELYIDSVSLNSRHGRPFANSDIQRITLKARELKITPVRIAKAAATTTEALERRLTLAYAPRSKERIALKESYKHLREKTLTAAQVKGNKTSLGYKQESIIQELIALLETGSINLEKSGVRKLLLRLTELVQGLELGLEDAAA